MNIRILGAHSTESGGLSMASLLVDGVLAMDAGGLTSNLSMEEQQRVRTVLLTHQHFDHTRDVVMLGANHTVGHPPVDLYGLEATLGAVHSLLLNDSMYLDFTRMPSTGVPAFRLVPVEPFRAIKVSGYDVLVLPVKHSVPSVGYNIASGDGKSLFYTGDTGPGLSECWNHISPSLIIIEVSGPNRQEEFLKAVGHLSARLLGKEIEQFRTMKKYWPRVIATHIAVMYEAEIRSEIQAVSRDLGVSIETAYEGMEVNL